MTTDTQIPALRAAELVKAYPGSDARAVDGLDLTIPQGIVYCLLGRNGAGKTTTIRMATTLLAPPAGSSRCSAFRLTTPRSCAP
ncbi:daunorubicin/doxorubicin resistance ATP-binding DrrA domain protein [Mycobacteroides abscessus MAB_030201_1075]|uniref:Daunorubicin/doxorubicin resistance ATP-binding DrrA domain protein n=1 Tax=Mycobacteroides abscessus MAB_030201_1075 TaxID=1335410 RepID=A0A829PNN0_9MYCO|nr:daunorubicin/doxorubicin resistance ATP-binding DrrA domain protein [Mycobacteroides abscessus MAB_030201_1075]